MKEKNRFFILRFCDTLFLPFRKVIKTQKIIRQFPAEYTPSSGVEAGASITVNIYNLKGQKIKTVEGTITGGSGKVEWDSSGVASGIYLVQVIVETPDSKISKSPFKKITIVKPR